MYPLNLYVENPESYGDFYRSHEIDKKIIINEYDEAAILPLKFFPDPKPWGRFAGGVIDKKNKFCAGLTRELRNQTLLCSSYDVSNLEFIYSNEVIYFAGVIFPFFGHVILETLSRFWGIIDKNDNYKLAFVLFQENMPIPSYFLELIDLLNISRERILIISKPTRFKKVIVPDESFMMGTGFSRKYMNTIEKIKSNLPNSSLKKVYCTRTIFKHDCINEEYFENFYKKQGYAIIAIEQLSVKEQLAIWKNVEDIVCVAGTLSHMILFSDQNTKLTILNRTEHSIALQAYINELAKPNCSFVDVHHNILPTYHNCQGFILGPTKYWEKFIKDNSMKWTNEDFMFDISPFLKEYLTKWCLYYSEERFFGGITNKTARDFLNFLRKELLP